jgi:uncharacterized protein YjbI with pentapeptide repeats
MDRDEAIRLLTGGPDGVREWNERRGRGEDIPDLSYADLNGADLRGADLNGADLHGVQFREADLRGVQLREADLRWAHFSGADLGHADLYGAILVDADLGSANLVGAVLNDAHLVHADLRGALLVRASLGGANLSSAICGGTTFGSFVPSEVTGLESIVHFMPSNVDVDTLFRSGGRIPVAFLRGCGVPEKLISYLPSIFGEMDPIQFSSCFISYSTKDEDFAKRLHSRMVQEKLRVWFAPEKMQGGKEISQQIDEAIRVYDKLLLVLSPESLRSDWVMTEIRKALKAEAKEGRRKLFPIRLVGFEMIRDWECIDTDTGKDLGVEIRKFFIRDFTNWEDPDAFEAAFAHLIRDLKAEASTGEEPGREGPQERP